MLSIQLLNLLLVKPWFDVSFHDGHNHSQRTPQQSHLLLLSGQVVSCTVAPGVRMKTSGLPG